MLCIISVIYASLSTIRQTDLKRIIAYSSVAHMGVATMSIFTFTKIGIIVSVFLQVAHGLVSSALFILVTILYNHHHTRTILYYRGVALTMPLFSSFFVFFNLCNIGMPLTANFVGEFISLLAGYFYSP
jgi:NADH:ubiquinone oxidoreductase subunit 4 (subunit M)